jgi:serine/threonine-protein kinase
VLLARGTTLGRYRIVDALRAGGMATLYLARRTGAAGFSKPVAIKVVREHLCEDKRFVEMFVSEAKLAARVDDPHVAHTEELGHENGTYFIAMEYVLGGSLAQIIAALRKQARALAPSMAIRIVADAARGLQAIHEATSESGDPLLIVHRDVSPQNILLSTKGIVKIIDLGVARARGVGRTESGLTGKVAYMSPEQARGDSVDRRTDVYALAVVLWEMLTGRRLFRAETDAELLKQVREPVIEPPSQWSLSVISPEVDAAIMRALSPEPSARPATAEVFCEELLAADPEARRVTTSELGGIVERTLKEKLASERKLLRDGSDGDDRVISEPVVGEDVIATRTILLTDGGGADEMTPTSGEAALWPIETNAASGPALTTADHGRAKSRWSLVAAGLIVALGIGIAIVFRPPTAAQASSPAPPPSASSPAPALTVLELVETPSPRAVVPTAPSTVASAPPPARTKRRGRSQGSAPAPSPAPSPVPSPAPASAPAPAPTGNTTIVHGTPLATGLQ